MRNPIFSKRLSFSPYSVHISKEMSNKCGCCACVRARARIKFLFHSNLLHSSDEMHNIYSSKGSWICRKKNAPLSHLNFCFFHGIWKMRSIVLMDQKWIPTKFQICEERWHYIVWKINHKKTTNETWLLYAFCVSIPFWFAFVPECLHWYSFTEKYHIFELNAKTFDKKYKIYSFNPINFIHLCSTWLRNIKDL